jgi:serine protease Do
VTPGSPAAQAGIHTGDQTVSVGNTRVPVGGDIITAIDGTPTTSNQELIVYLETETHIGDTVDVTLIRGGKEMDMSVTLTERPEQS